MPSINIKTNELFDRAHFQCYGPSDVYVVVRDARGNVTSPRLLRVTVLDETPPTITLLGPSSIDIPVGCQWGQNDDSWVTTDDNCRSISSVTVVRSPVVDTSRAGSHIVTYTARDAAGNMATVTRTVNVVNTPPEFTTANQAMQIGINPSEFDLLNLDLALKPLLSVRDLDCDQTLIWQVVGHASHGRATVQTPLNSQSGGDTGVVPHEVTYTPNNNFVGTDTFTIEVRDGLGYASRTITVNVVNTAPQFVGTVAPLNVPKWIYDATFPPGGEDITSLFRASDVDSGQTLTWTQSSPPSHGTLHFGGATASSGSADITTKGFISYLPASGFTGKDSFAVRVSDGFDVATRVISVNVVIPSEVTAADPMRTARQRHTTTVMTEGWILLVGGQGSDGGALSSAEWYDSSGAKPTGGSDDAGSLLQPRMAHTATLLPDGKVLVAGGRNNASGFSSILMSAELYDPATGTFSSAGNLLGPRQRHTATLLADGTVLLVGGGALTLVGGVPVISPLAAAELYDPATGTFTFTGSMGTARIDHAATLLADGRVLVVGGSTDAITLAPALSSAEIYDPSTKTFSPTSNMISGRRRPLLTTLGGSTVLVAGGSAGSPAQALSSAEHYDSINGTFTAAASLTVGRVHHTTTLIDGVLVLLAGGSAASETSTSDLYRVDERESNPGPAVLSAITPNETVGGSSDLTLFVRGHNFVPGARVIWNELLPLTTRFHDSALLTAQIPASELSSTADLSVVHVTVTQMEVPRSAPNLFTIKSNNIGPYQSSVVDAGQTTTTEVLPSVSGKAGLSASFTKTGDSWSYATVTTAVYTSNPVAGTAIDTGGGIVDLQIISAGASDTATVKFYYGDAVTGAAEIALLLRYYDGSAWVNLLSSGGATPIKDTTDDLDSTVSGGRFTVVFNNTSTPKITELGGTFIAMSINRAPLANADAVTLAEDDVLAVGAPGVLGNDSDPDGDGLQAVLVSGTSHGQVTLQTDGSFHYTPQANYNGLDIFSYKVNDGNADSSVAMVSITVMPVNDVPVLANPLAHQTGAYGSAFSYNVPANTFSDVDAEQTLSYAASGLPPGIFFDAATRTLSGIPRAAGTFPVSVIATDDGTPAPLSASASFVFTVSRAVLIGTAHDASRVYGSANPALAGSLTGVVNSDNITATYSAAASAASPVGTYPIVPSLFDLESKLGNYTVTQVNGTLTVKNVPPVVNAGPDQEKVALDEVTFTGSFTDPSSPSHVAGWDFGDGSPAVIGTLTPSHVYAHHGVYTVTLTVTDSHLDSASDTLTVSVISALGCATEARDGLVPFVQESKRLKKAVKDLTASLEPKLWVDEVHLNPKGGKRALVYWRQATDMMEQLLKPSQKRENDARDEDDGEDDDDFKKIFNDSKKDTLSAGAITAIEQALADVICASTLISETLYLENEGLVALDPRRQKRVDSALDRAKDYLDQANAVVDEGDFGKAVRRFISSWNNTQDAIKTAGRSQSAKELVKAMELTEESLDPKYWTDEPLFLHLELNTGIKGFNLMQSAARELANVVQDAAKGRVIAAVGQQAAEELADLLAKARLVSRTLYTENERLVAVNAKNQKSVDASLKRAKENLDKGAAAAAANDLDKALNHYANAWDDSVKAIEEAAKAR
ncbi:MAG: Ig-like domain-containing protein [Verrucomicrobia bacterium]|nr:Ig-like domain-containing protein [Verrucomicrobiota bacterium]